MDRDIRVYAPATVANVACGFDIFGFALELPGDEIYLKLVEKPGVVIKSISGDGGLLPHDPEKNTAGVVALKLLERLGSSCGIEIELHKQMPLSSGLGSSAASAVGALYGINKLLGSPLTQKDLLEISLEGERVACGSGHADNTSPGMLGGFVLVCGYQPLDVLKIPCALNLYCTVLHPHVKIDTRSARQILKKKISLEEHVEQTGNASGLIAGLMLGDEKLISRCLQDRIAEPVRATLIPGYELIKAAALGKGALGVGIAGSGPAIFALSQNLRLAETIGEAMFCASTVKSSLYISKLNDYGPKVLA
jgi:homoserine kinase